MSETYNLAVRSAAHAGAHAWRSENNFMEFVLSFHLYVVLGIELKLSTASSGACL